MPKNANGHPLGLSMAPKPAECLGCSAGRCSRASEIPACYLSASFENLNPTQWSQHEAMKASPEIITYETKSLGTCLTLRHTLKSRWRWEFCWGHVCDPSVGRKEQRSREAAVIPPGFLSGLRAKELTPPGHQGRSRAGGGKGFICLFFNWK